MDYGDGIAGRWGLVSADLIGMDEAWSSVEVSRVGGRSRLISCLAVAHGLSAQIGSVETGKLADLVLWQPAFFGVKPELVIKGGVITYAQMGDANASIPTPPPVYPRPMFGSYGNAVGPTSLAFVSQASRERVGEYGLAKEVVSVEHCRDIGKADMRLNDVVPNIEVEPETYKVNVDGEEITCEPAEKLPLAQLYHLF